jgi:gelsolin
MRDERGSKPEAFMHSEGDNDLDEFWAALGGAGPVASAASGGADADAAAAATSDVKLFRLSDASGTLTFTLAHQGPLTKSMLDPKDAFIVDSGSQVFVWIGKLASTAERKGGMQYAQKYLVDFNRPNYLPISRVIDGGENDGMLIRERERERARARERECVCVVYKPTHSIGFGFSV